MRQRLAGPSFFLVLAMVFWLVNRPAYTAYFSDDDLDNLNLSRSVSWRELGAALATPRLSPDNYRPVGQVYYRLLGRAAHLTYPPYVIALQTMHLGTAALVWLFLRRERVGIWPAMAGVLVFTFHGALVPAHWKPMYVFDVLCGLLCAATLVLWQVQRWLAGLVLFWLAYKAKEMALLLPLVLLGHAWLRERAAWRTWAPRLSPYFAVLLCFGLQALVKPQSANNDYSLHFTAAAFVACGVFYAAHMAVVPGGGFAFWVLPVVVRHPLVLLGVIAAWALLLPMLFLPGRLYAVYLYVPALGLAMATAGLAARWPRTMAALLMLWLPWQYARLREERRPILALGHANRAFVQALSQHFARQPRPMAVVYEGAPVTCQRWGVEGALRVLAGNPGLPVYVSDQPEARKALAGEGTMVVSYDATAQRLVEASPLTQPAWLDFGREAGLRQLEEGWYARDSDCRWIRPRALLQLRRPAGARAFAVQVNLGPGQAVAHRQRLEVIANGVPVGVHEFKEDGRQTVQWATATAPLGLTQVELRIKPGFQPRNGDPRLLGVQVCALGYRE